MATWAVEGPHSSLVAAAMLKPSRADGSPQRHPAVISRSSPEATAALVAHLKERGVHFPGATAPEPTITQFAAAWCDAAGVHQEVVMALRLMKLTHVLPHRLTGGDFRAAAPADAERLVDWAGAFFEEIGHPEPSGRCAETVMRRIDEGRLFVWCDPGLVSMAGWGGPTPSGARVNFVYTPPESRGRGYASGLRRASQPAPARLRPPVLLSLHGRGQPHFQPDLRGDRLPARLRLPARPLREKNA